MEFLAAIGSFGLFLLLLLAAWYDVRTRRIPNRLTLAGFAVGMLHALLEAGWQGLAGALGGAALGFGIFFLLYGLGAFGAGDVKLMAAAGAFLGVPLVLEGIFWSMVAGGLIAAVLAFRRSAVRQVTRNLGGLLSFWLHARRAERADWLSMERGEALKLPYGVAIALGCALAALFPRCSVF